MQFVSRAVLLYTDYLENEVREVIRIQAGMCFSSKAREVMKLHADFVPYASCWVTPSPYAVF